MSDSPEFSFLDIVYAEFRPRRTDDLIPGASEYIGHRTHWRHGWVIDDGPYAGDYAMIPCDFDTPYPFAWVPKCDLVIVEDATL